MLRTFTEDLARTEELEKETGYGPMQMKVQKNLQRYRTVMIERQGLQMEVVRLPLYLDRGEGLS